jgi:hypothetical protein
MCDARSVAVILLTRRLKMNRVILAVGMAAILALGVALGGLAEASTATWAANTEADLNGYNMYRAPGTCAAPGAFVKIDTFTKTELTGVLDNPATDGPYAHKLTAFDTANNESLFSTCVEMVYNVVPPKAPALQSVKP